MKRAKRWRYTCEFCRKSGSSGGHMKRHEAGCCRNPHRVCGMCREAEGEQRPLLELVLTLEEHGLDELRAVAGGCPACMLAAVLGVRARYEDEHGPAAYESDTGAVHAPAGVGFDFKSERDRFWAEVNDAANIGAHNG